MRRLLVALAVLCGAAGPAPRLAVLATPASGTETTLHLVAPGDTALPPAVARFEHAPWASVQAAVADDGRTVIAVADRDDRRDRSFASALVRLGDGAQARWLVDGVVEASRPHPLAGGKALVSRGRAGRATDEYRIDELSVDEVDLATGATRTVHAGSGYLLYIAGVHGGEVILYRVGPGGADLVAVALADGRVRTLAASLPPFARDFTIEGASVVFLDRHEVDARRWITWSVDLASGARRALGEGTAMSRGLGRAAAQLPAAPGRRLSVAGPVP